MDYPEGFNQINNVGKWMQGKKTGRHLHHIPGLQVNQWYWKSLQAFLTRLLRPPNTSRVRTVWWGASRCLGTALTFPLQAQSSQDSPPFSIQGVPIHLFTLVCSQTLNTNELAGMSHFSFYLYWIPPRIFFFLHMHNLQYDTKKKMSCVAFLPPSLSPLSLSSKVWLPSRT